MRNVDSKTEQNSQQLLSYVR